MRRAPAAPLGIGAPATFVALALLAMPPAGRAQQAAARPADQTSLAQLMGLLAARQEARAQFDETQYVAILTQPLHSEGTLSYRAPDHLEERIDKPRRRDLVVDHGMLDIQIGHHRHSMPLAQYPQFAPLLDSLRATLAGDATALQRAFLVQLSGPLSDWQLRLVPRSVNDTAAPAGGASGGGAPDLSIRRITLRGMEARIMQITIEQNDGDRAVMRLRPLT